MNTRKLIFGLFAMATLLIASCTTETSDVELYENGVEKYKITKSNKSIEKWKITKNNSGLIEKDKIDKTNKKNKN